MLAQHLIASKFTLAPATGDDECNGDVTPIETPVRYNLDSLPMSETAEIVKSGTWLYDKKVPLEVWIVRQNFDYHSVKLVESAQSTNDPHVYYEEPILVAQSQVL